MNNILQLVVPMMWYAIDFLLAQVCMVKPQSTFQSTVNQSKLNLMLLQTVQWIYTTFLGEKYYFFPNGNSLYWDCEEFDPVVTHKKNISWKLLVRRKSLVWSWVKNSYKLPMKCSQKERQTWHECVLEVYPTETECCFTETTRNAWNLFYTIKLVSYLIKISSDYNEGGVKGREESRQGHKTLEEPSLLYIVKHKVGRNTTIFYNKGGRRVTHNSRLHWQNHKWNHGL